MVHSKTDAPEESDLWTAWQLFPLDDDQTCDFKDQVSDWVGVELLYDSVKTEVWQLELETEIDEMWKVNPHEAEGALGPLMSCS